MKYIPSLDGVRGLCILAVMLSHYNLFSFGGWLGVEIFFVLSGFLITAILLESRTLPLKKYLGTFYMRRILRIFPVYLATTGLFALIEIFKPQTLPLFWRDSVSLFTYSYNIVSVWRQAHFVSLLQATPYTHFWSLCVEEQFYFVWPFLVYFLNGKRLRTFVLAAIVLAPFLRGYVAYAIARHASPVAAGISVYVLTTSHVDSFMLGTALNLFSLTRARAGALCGIAFGLLLSCGVGHWWFIHKFQPDAATLLGRTNFGFSPLVLAGGQHIWGYSVIALFGAALILWAKEKAPRVLTWSPLVHVGKVSYGAYIFHLPLFLLVFSSVNVKNISGLLLLPVYLLMVVGIATISFYGFEKKFLTLKHYFQYRAGRYKWTDVTCPAAVEVGVVD
ncbi:MAG: acyltransferase [Candidatus Angelobacter sp.]